MNDAFERRAQELTQKYIDEFGPIIQGAKGWVSIRILISAALNESYEQGLKKYESKFTPEQIKEFPPGFVECWNNNKIAMPIPESVKMYKEAYQSGRASVIKELPSKETIQEQANKWPHLDEDSFIVGVHWLKSRIEKNKEGERK